MTNDTPFQSAMKKIDAANAEDPNVEYVEDQAWPKEVLYSERMTRWLHRLAPDAVEEVQLAARAQHICRWKIARSSYPDGRKGYLDWRNACKVMHAKRTSDILREVGFSPESIQRVSDIIQKKHMSDDSEAQLLENVACLVFLENYFAAFSEKYDAEKVIHVVRRTWQKMSPLGHEAALTISMPDALNNLVKQAIQDL